MCSPGYRQPGLRPSEVSESELNTFCSGVSIYRLILLSCL